MKIEDVINILKSNETKNKSDNRIIINYKNNVEFGIELGVVFAKSNNIYEVFIHSKINNEVISQILYKSFDKEVEAEKYYNKIEQYIIHFNVDEIVNEIKKMK